MDDKAEVLQELGKIPWFQELKPRYLQKIADIAHLRNIKNGEVLFREGEKEGYVYILIQGRVALDIFVPHRGKVRIYTAEPWDVFGWSSLTSSVRGRTASGTCIMDGLVIALDAEKLRQACEEDHDLGYVVMRRLANIIASRLMVTRLQLLDMFAAPEAKND
jgi:CRP-like cAMP-binding protein